MRQNRGKKSSVVTLLYISVMASKIWGDIHPEKMSTVESKQGLD